MKKRYDIFRDIHKAVRGMLYDTAITLQVADFSVEEEAVPAMEKLECVLAVLRTHAKDEATYIYPAVKRLDASLCCVFETEQVKLEIRLQELRYMVKQFFSAISPGGKTEAAEALCPCFNEFMALHLLHMNRQEAEINNLLWKQYTDE